MIITAQLRQTVDPSLYDREVFPISRSPTERELSPFFLGPIRCNGLDFRNMENAWQYAKVYPKLGHLDSDNNLTSAYWDWAEHGAASKAERYPAGRGAVPAFSLFRKKTRLSYTAARKLLYIPMYADLAVETELYDELLSDLKHGARLLIRDFDAYTPPKGMTFQQQADLTTRKLGHGMVLAEMLRHGRDLKWIKELII